MNTLQTATPATPAAAASGTAAPASPDTPAANEGNVLPWVAAMQAALTQQTKDLAPLAAPAAVTGKGPGAAEDGAAPATTDKQQPAADAAAATLAGVPLPLIATLPPIPSAIPPAPPPSAPSDARRTQDGDTLAATAGTVAAGPRVPIEPRPAATHDATKTAPAADTAVNSDAISQIIEHAAARDGNGRETNAQPTAQFALAHAAASPVPQQATAPAAQLQINAAVGTSQWGAEVGQKVVWMIGAKEHVAELRLNPPELGPLDIKLTVNSHETTAVFTSPHGAVRDAVESALPRLREVLAESGIMLGNASVTSDGPRDGSAFAAPQGQGQRGEFSVRGLEPASGPAQSAPVSLVRRNGLVDLFA